MNQSIFNCIVVVTWIYLVSFWWKNILFLEIFIFQYKLSHKPKYSTYLESLPFDSVHWYIISIFLLATSIE